MTYGREDIELMISNLPMHGAGYTLDECFTPQRRHLKAKAWHLPIFTRGRKIINCLIQYFQTNPDDIKNKSWINSGIPYFLWDVRKFSGDRDVRRLLQIPNIELVKQG